MNTVFELLKELKQDIQLLKDKDCKDHKDTKILSSKKKPFTEFLVNRCQKQLLAGFDGYYGLFVHDGHLVVYSYGFLGTDTLIAKLKEDQQNYESVPPLSSMKIMRSVTIATK